MRKSDGVIFNISGGQVNFARDNANISATQTNRLCNKELDIILKAIENNLTGLKQGEIDKITTDLNIIKDELKKPTPEKNKLKDCITMIAPMMTIANGLPVLEANLQKLIEFVMQYI